MELMDHQIEASKNLGNGKILYGGVGSGKSATALDYYVREQSPRHLYVITTAKKRDSLDWEKEAALFCIGSALEDDQRVHGILTVDSWNNIGNYLDVEDAFFIFDEQRLVGQGAWVKSFMKIAKKNTWIMLTATPGDTWLDYAPVFIANGFYKNITEFRMKHVVYAPFKKFPVVIGYWNEQKLEMLRNEMLVEMPYLKHTERILNYIDVGYDVELFRRAYKDRWHVYEDRPIADVAELWRVLRRVVNTSEDRIQQVRELMKWHPRLIVFYNFNYELDILRTLNAGLNVFELNGHRKDPLPDGEKWVYLVQYVAGAEAWNCVTTDAMCLFSLTYSYKNFEQAQGRIDRLNTLYTSLYYYILVSNSVVDRAIKNSLALKKGFNERKYLLEFDKFGDVDVEFLEKCEI